MYAQMMHMSNFNVNRYYKNKNGILADPIFYIYNS